MGKTITLRIDDDTYDIFKTAVSGAEADNIQFYRICHPFPCEKKLLVDGHEMAEILKNKNWFHQLKKAKKILRRENIELLNRFEIAETETFQRSISKNISLNLR